MHSTVDIEQVLVKLDESLQKVYAEKNITSQWDIDPRSFFIGDDSDLFELLGNVMDNAYKWAQSTVLYRTKVESAGENLPRGITIEIHDDGPGIDKSERTAVLRRGTRAEGGVVARRGAISIGAHLRSIAGIAVVGTGARVALADVRVGAGAHTNGC